MLIFFQKLFRFALPSALFVGLGACQAGILVSDPVEPKDGWRIITKGAFTGGGAATGLIPATGAAFFNGVNAWDAKPPETNRGAAKFFKGVTFAPGTYEVTLSVGRPSGVEFPGNLTVLLLADTDKTGVYAWSNRIIGVMKKDDHPPPPEGGWARRTYVFTLRQDARTAGGQPVAGATLGVMVLSNVRPGAGFAFDDLTITRRP